MQTKEEVEKEFRADLQRLLDKYGAELEADDHYQVYAECGENVRMTVDIPGIWDKDGEPVREYTEIDLGSHLWPTPNARSEPTVEAASPPERVGSTDGLCHTGEE